MLEDDPHALGVRGEGEVGQDVIFLLDTVRVLNDDPLLVTLDQLHAKVIVGEADKGNFIRGTCLEFSEGRVIGVGIGRGYIMTEGKAGYEVADYILLLPALLKVLSLFDLIRWIDLFISNTVQI